MSDYTRTDRRQNYLSKQNTKLSKIILVELESGNPNTKVLDNCFAAIKKNQHNMWQLSKKNTIRYRRVKSKM